MACIDTTQFDEPGLYLIWPDGERMDVTRAHIESRVRAMLDDPNEIPPEVKAATAFQPCDICPERATAEICHAIMTGLPFVSYVDRYMSYDKVLAVFRAEPEGVLRVVETTMQEALKYVTLLALTHYCEVGRSYGAYFKGVDPLMSPPEIAHVVYGNVYLDQRGDMEKIQALLEKMQEEILITTRCQAERLRLISKRDALLNAFIATYTVVELVLAELMQRLSESQVAS